MTDAERQGPPSSVLGGRLASEQRGRLPTVEELGLTDVKRVAMEVQKQRSFAQINDMHGTLSGRPGARWVIETHGIFGVIGEQMLVAIEAEVEKELTRRALRDSALSNARIAHESRTLRFFSEAQANSLVVALHGIANLAARSLEFDRPLEPTELKKMGIKTDKFTPGSTESGAWLSMNLDTVAALKAAAAERGEPSVNLAKVVVDIVDDPTVLDLINLRNVHYHRWRGETAGVTGINRSAESAADTLASGRSVAFGRDLLPPYTEAESSLTELDATASAALIALAGHLDELHRAWGESFKAAFNPRL